MTAIRLDGAAVAVTGGARGIGLATAKAFAAKGAHVYIGDLDEHLAKEAAADVGGHGFALDVRSKESFAAFLAAVDAPLAVLVNNAGIMPAGRFVDEDDAVTLIAKAWGDLAGAEVDVKTVFQRVRVEILFHSTDAALTTATRLSEAASRGSKGK